MKRSHLRLALAGIAVFFLGAASTLANGVVAPPTGAKFFGALSIGVGGTTTATLTISNTNPATNLTGVTFTDTLPPGITVSTPNGLLFACTPGSTLGPITAVAGTGSIVVGTSTLLAGGGACTVQVNVTGISPGVWINAYTPSDATAGSGLAATAVITVLPQSPPVITKAFGAPLIGLNGTTSLTFTISNPNAAIALTGVSFTDTLPAGLNIANFSGLSSNCGGTALASFGQPATVSLIGGTLAGGASCTVSVNVTGVSVGPQNNSVTVSSALEGAGNTASATLIVATLYLRGSNMIGRGTQAGVITFDPGPADSFKR